MAPGCMPMCSAQVKEVRQEPFALTAKRNMEFRGFRSLGTATTKGPCRSWGEATLCLPKARAQHLSSEAIQDHTSTGHLEAGDRASGQLG